MKRRLTVVYLIISLLFVSSCGTSKNDDELGDEAISYPLPAHAIRMIYADYIHVEGKVDSVKGIFLIDTGADNLYLDTIFFKEGKFRYRNLMNYKIEGIGNSYQEIVIIRDSVNFSFGEKDYKTTFVPVMELKPIGGDFIDGLLGTDFFMNSVLGINYAREYIILSDSIELVDVTGYEKLPLEMVGTSIAAQISMNVNNIPITGKFMLDVANPSSSLTSLYAFKNNLGTKITNKERFYTKYGGVGGESAGYEFFAESLTISGFNLKNAVMGYSTDTAGMLEEGDYIGILGNNILDRFDLIIDFPNLNLYLKPGDNFDEPFIFNRLGFGYVDRCETLGGWIVAGLYENSEAERLGLKVDDKIISVNDTPVGEIPYETQTNYIKKIDRIKLVYLRSNVQNTIEFDLKPLITPF